MTFKQWRITDRRFKDFDNKGYVTEDALANPEISVGTGYSESKWVSERILDKAGEVTALKPTVVRLGQVAGDVNGVWNETEWFPSIVKSAASLKCLPNLDGVRLLLQILLPLRLTTFSACVMDYLSIRRSLHD